MKKLSGRRKVYNLEVRDLHNFLVGDCGVVVHNLCAKGKVKEFLEHADFAENLAKVQNPKVKKGLARLKELKDANHPNYQKFLGDFVDDIPVEHFDAWEGLIDFPLLRKKAKALEYVDELKVPKLGSSTTTDYRKTFKEVAFPEIADDIYQVHHAMPQKIYNNYPDIMTKSELHSLQNLRGIPKNNHWIHQTITNNWAQFYLDFPNFTRQQALDFAKQIDDNFGHLFIPPIR